MSGLPRRRADAATRPLNARCAQRLRQGCVTTSPSCASCAIPVSCSPPLRRAPRFALRRSRGRERAELRQRLLATVQNELSAVQVRATTFESQVTRASNATRATYTPTLKLFQNEVASFRRDVSRFEAEIGGAAAAGGGSTAAAKPAAPPRREVVKGSQRERVLEARLAQQGAEGERSEFSFCV